MLIDRHIDAYAQKHLQPQIETRRLANGSIDYAFYRGRAVKCRSVAFRAAGELLLGLLRQIGRASTGPFRKSAVDHDVARIAIAPAE